MTNEIINNDIENKIYTIRGVQVMLDSDLAELYGVETKRINESVRRNKEKFPERFTWILNYDEEINLRSQIATSSLTSNYGGKRYNSRVFIEQGVAMLATILKSKIAIKVSISIMDAFVKMRHFLIDNKYIYKSLNNININIKLIEHDKKIEKIFNKLKNDFEIYNLINKVGGIKNE